MFLTRLQPDIPCRFFDSKRMYIRTGLQSCWTNLKVFSLFLSPKFSLPFPIPHITSLPELFVPPIFLFSLVPVVSWVTVWKFDPWQLWTDILISSLSCFTFCDWLPDNNQQDKVTNIRWTTNFVYQEKQNKTTTNKAWNSERKRIIFILKK